MAVSDDEARPALTQVYFDAVQKRLMASDGIMMAIVPVEDVSEGETSGTIDPLAIEMARERGCRLEATAEKVTIGLSGWSVDREDIWYPDCATVTDLIKTNADTAAPVLTLSAERLYRLAQAICDTPWLGIRIFFPPKPTDPVEVRPEIENGARGIIMPLANEHSARADLTPLIRALQEGGEITSAMRHNLKRLFGLE